MVIYGIGVIIFLTVDYCYNYVWINILGFFPPVPFGGYTVATIAVPALFATMWFRIPKNARTEKEIKRRFNIFLVTRLYDSLVAWVYVYFTLLFLLIPSNYQPILGLVCPILREILLQILNFITCRAGGGRRVKMGKRFLNTASGSGSNITQGPKYGWHTDLWNL